MNFCFWKYFPFLLHILTCFPTIIATSKPDFVFKSCMESSGNYTKNSPYDTNLNTLLTSLPSAMDNNSFVSSYFGLTPNTVYAISVCTGNVEIGICRDCVRDAINKLPQICPNSKEAIGRLDNCILRYSNEPITGILEDFFAQSCMESSGNYTNNSPYDTNLNDLLTSLPSGMDNYGFSSSYIGLTPNTVYAISLCRGDVEINTCRDCVGYAISKLPQICPNSKEAIGWYDNCMLRYSNKSISGKYTWRSPTIYAWNTFNVSSKDQFNEALETLLSGLRKSTSNGGIHKKFATNHTTGPDEQTIYGLMQCTPDLSVQDCDSCLSDSVNLATSSNCNGKKGCRVLNPSCNMRYEIYQFFNDNTSETPAPAPAPPPSNKNGTTAQTRAEKDGTTAQTTIIIVISTVGFGIVLILCVFIYLKKKKHKKSKRRVETMNEYSSINDISNVDSLQYDFGIINEATNNFSHANKLGQGGFGAVYQGKLQNGQEIAVKRLSRNSGQGEIEFKNEVMLVAKLQHRNLVRLLGFSLEGTERLLIYEFVTNSSLDQFIFNPTKRVSLNWDTRYKIISGIAKGLLYLHEDSRLRIVHRDLKAGNVLLDSEMNPKISDFGMARLFVMDETEGSTNRIVGTYGYMAPEYAMHGHFSVKSDVFSFGVLILEIMTGQKNNYSRNGDNVENLLSNAWKSWREGTAQSLIDPTLCSNSSSTQEMMRCIHIGLLCIQENVVERPTMASIVPMFSSYSLSLPVPSPPTFILDDQSTGSEGTFTLASQNEASLSELYPR